ncbi:MAG: type II secretion system GspH family protein [Azoarcus sp.]|nr:type II secretion system GspH family protein [Azoarcus sp.]
MSMLSKLLSMPRTELKSRLQAVDAGAVKGRGLRRKFEKIRSKQGGFTLLELLVVVAILAAIAGTATIMLQDTDRKGAAAAHVAMMDELSKGIQTYMVLNQGKYPNNFDSLLFGSSTLETTTTPAGDSLFDQDLIGNLTVSVLNSDGARSLGEANISTYRLLGTQCGTSPAAVIAEIKDKSNDIVPANLYRPSAAHGCGRSTDTGLFTLNGSVYTSTVPVAIWKASPERVNADEDDTLVAFGIGADSTLFKPTTIGALSNVPVYRHVESHQYNRFIVLFNVGDVTTSGSKGNGKAIFQAIIDGAGDTKDEELGEVDNIRNT